MPLARLNIEQIEGNRWVAEAEAGGFAGMPNFRHVRLHATSYEGIMAEVSEFYYRQVPPAIPKAVRVTEAGEVVEDAPEPTALDEARSREDAEGEGVPADEDADPRDDERNALRREAEGLGIDIDLRWGVKRLQDEIAKAKAGEKVAE
jgi:hypothetical protein